MNTLNDRGTAVFYTTLVLLIVATIFTGLRVISKLCIVKRFAADDAFTVLAWVLAAILSAAIMWATTVGLGKPDVDILPEWQEPLKRALYIFTVFYNPSLMATKTAILILYIRMAAAHPFLKAASIFVMAVVNLAGAVLTFLNIFQCRPIAAAFTAEDGKCIDVVALYLSSAPINVLTDLAILLLPLPILTQLRMEFRAKVILVATFVVGGFVTIVDIVRIGYLQDALRTELAVDEETSLPLGDRPANFTYYASFSLMWSAVEVSVGLVCCCVLVLKPIMQRIVPSFMRERRSTFAATHSLPLDQPKDRHSQGSPESVHGLISPVSVSVSHVPTIPMTPIPEQQALDVEVARDEQRPDDGMDFFQMLASDPPTTERPIDPIAPHPQSPNPETSATNQSLQPLHAVDHFQRHSNEHRSRRPTILSRKAPTIENRQEPTQNFFDFVNMRGRVPLTQLSAREAWWPIMFVSILFFMWGFAYGLLGTLNAQIQSLLRYNSSQLISLHNAYWVGYFLGPLLIGYWTLTRQGFKATFMAGLALYACGAMSFWPSSVLKSYPGFFISNFIVASGLSLLEVAANPFIALAGPGEYSEARLNFAQAIQGIGSVVSPILANKALFSGLLNEEDLFRVQWCYLAVALFVVALAVVFFYAPLSEASDDELQAVTLQRLYNANMDEGEKSLGLDIRKLLCISGILVMSTYVGSQEAVSLYWGPLVSGAKPGADAFWNLTISHATFAIARFFASGLMFVGVPPRILLAVCYFCTFLTCLLAEVLPQGNAPLAMLILYTFFESPIFPTVFAMTLRGQGRHTKLVSTGLTMAIVGGAIWPTVVYGVEQAHPSDPRYALRVTVSLYGVSLLWPLVWSTTRKFRRWVDPDWSRQRSTAETGNAGHASTWDNHRPGLEKAASSHVEDRPVADEERSPLPAEIR